MSRAWSQRHRKACSAARGPGTGSAGHAHRPPSSPPPRAAIRPPTPTFGRGPSPAPSHGAHGAPKRRPRRHAEGGSMTS
eukprot:2630386-Alexandrium_andersonii.AAC.1